MTRARYVVRRALAPLKAWRAEAAAGLVSHNLPGAVRQSPVTVGLGRSAALNPHAMSSLRTLRGIAASAHAVSSDSESRGTTQGGAESAGVEEVHSFQAETRRLLDIVTNSLYTDKEVFVRELVSNASDALEKCRHAHLAKGADPGALEVTITTDDALRRFTITDSGMGMSRADLVSNLGTIARSGSKAFVDELSAGGEGATASTNIIGKFGVGFYSAFMVSERVDVFSSTGDGVGWKWSSSGDGTYTLASCGVELRAPVGGNADAKTNGEEDEVGGKAPWRGTRVVLHVKEADRAIAAAGWAVENTLKKYSAFVGFPVNLNGRRTNDIDALWTKRANEVSDEDATTFYRFVGGALDAPAFRLHFSADAPLTIRALLFAPSENPEKGFAARGVEGDQSGLSLYSRRVLIQANARGLLPGFMRWVRGVVDCEDVPLNISRESLQDSDLVRRLGEIITRRMIKFLGERAKKEPERYAEWYAKMGVFIKEGVCGDQSYAYKESLVPLLRFDSSRKQEEVEEGSEPKSEADGDGGKPAKPAQVSLDEYVARMPAGQKDIYYLVSSGGRKQAESSPYLELTRAKGYEVLFLYAHVDEFVMQHVRRHKGKDLVSVEVAELEDDADAKKEGDADGKSEGEGEALGEEAMEKLCQWFAEKALPGRVTGVKSSSRLRSSPALLVGHEPEAMRRYRLMLTMMQDDATATKLDDLQSAAGLELNPRHAIMRAIDAARASSDPEAQRAAQLVAEQVFDNARVAAGALSDPREMVGRINQILELALPKPSTPPIP